MPVLRSRTILCGIIFAGLAIGGCGDPIEAEGPDSQQEFARVVGEGNAAWSKAVDDDSPVQSDKGKRAAKKHRDAELCDLFEGDRDVKGWIGEVNEINLGRDGGAGLEVTAANGEGNGASLQSPEPVSEDSDAYDAISELAPGDRIKFSGNFAKKDDAPCVQITNLTGTFYMDSPDFSFEFTEVKKVS